MINELNACFSPKLLVIVENTVKAWAKARFTVSFDC